jgi:hypothetical protein
VQHIKTKSWALRTSSDLSCSTKMDLEKIYVGQKTHDKIKLEYIESLSSSIFKVIGSPKKERGAVSKIKNKSDNMTKIKYNKKKYNHAYQ